MRIARIPLGLSCMCVLATTATFYAQRQSPPPFRYGTSYTFERVSATRVVNDEFDRGPLTLAVNVYRPVTNDRRRVVLWSHGSTGGWEEHPGELTEFPRRSMIEFFISRGFTIVAATRRGVGFSTGTYREECPFSAGQCSWSDNIALAPLALEEAIRDTTAVMDQIVLGRIVPADAKIILGGVSRGGFLSLVVAGVRPESVSGVVSFVGGWLAINDAAGDEENFASLRFQAETLAVVGTRTEAPTLWLYGAGDSYYGEVSTRQFFRAFMQSGGRGEYVLISDHALADGHLIPGEPGLWEGRLDGFLRELDR
jgi:pimeloyl-ACP methyl ester carboxylesterase